MFSTGSTHRSASFNRYWKYADTDHRAEPTRPQPRTRPGTAHLAEEIFIGTTTAITMICPADVNSERAQQNRRTPDPAQGAGQHPETRPGPAHRARVNPIRQHCHRPADRR